MSIQQDSVMLLMGSYVARRRPSIESFDTETYKGYCTLLCCSYDMLHRKDLSPIPTEEALAWIYYHTNKGLRASFFFNLAFDAASILKEGLTHFSEAELQEFRKTKEATFGAWTVKYIVNKGLIITHSMLHHSVHCYDIAGLLFDGSSRGSLEAMAGKHLGSGKLPNVDASKMNVDLAYWRENLQLIVRYCMRDAKLTKDLANRLLDYSSKTLHFYPRMFYSKASLSKAWLQLNHPGLERLFMHSVLNGNTREPKWASHLGLKEQQLDLIYQTFWGGIFDVWTFGHIEDVSEVDINSAYPDAISGLMALDKLEMRQGDSYDPRCVTGFYKIEMRYGEYPMPYREQYWVAYPSKDAKITPRAKKIHTQVERKEVSQDIEMLFDKVDKQALRGLSLHSPAVIELAERLYFQRSLATDRADWMPITPVIEELEKGGYLQQAQQQLLHGRVIDGITEEGMLVDEQILYPESNQAFVQYTTKPKLDFFQSRGLSFRVLDSLQFYGEYKPEFPDFPDLYARRLDLQMRRDSTNAAETTRIREYDFMQYMLKIVMNACYGSMAQLRQGQGTFTNLIYAALITSMTHVKIYELLEKVGFADVVAIATDAVKYKDHGQVIPCGPGLGQCKKEFEKASVTMYQNGIYFVEKGEELLEFRTRGFPRRTVEDGKETMTIDRLKQAKGESLLIEWTKPYRLLQALASPSTCVSNLPLIGVWLPHKYQLSLKDVCRKRMVPAPWTFERFNNEEVPSEAVFDLMRSSVTRPLPKPKPKIRRSAA